MSSKLAAGGKANEEGGNMDPYASEITVPIRQEVRAHGPAEVARRLNVSEECVREIAPKESWEHDQVSQK